MKSITQSQAHVQVLGFSLRALLETKVLLENVEIMNHVGSLTLLSPALFIQKTSMMRFGESILRRVKPTPSVFFIAALAHKSSIFDLDILVANPGYYNTNFARRFKTIHLRHLTIHSQPHPLNNPSSGAVIMQFYGLRDYLSVFVLTFCRNWSPRFHLASVVRALLRMQVQDPCRHIFESWNYQSE